MGNTEASVTSSHAWTTGMARSIEDFLIWVYADQMALTGGAAAAAFTGYSPHVAMMNMDRVSGGLKPLAPKVHPVAEQAHAVLQVGLPRAEFDTLVAYAQRRTRPDTGEGLGPRVARVAVTSFTRDGVPEAPYVAETGRVVEAMHWQATKVVKRRGEEFIRPVGRKRAIGHIIPWTGESRMVILTLRRRYREWIRAMTAARSVLAANGIDTFPTTAPALPMQWWER